jgi:hypothetical protein
MIWLFTPTKFGVGLIDWLGFWFDSKSFIIPLTVEWRIKDPPLGGKKWHEGKSLILGVIQDIQFETVGLKLLPKFFIKRVICLLF